MANMFCSIYRPLWAMVAGGPGPVEVFYAMAVTVTCLWHFVVETARVAIEVLLRICALGDVQGIGTTCVCHTLKTFALLLQIGAVLRLALGAAIP